MRSPSRRSRNIGTAKQGHGQDNRLALPISSHPTYSSFFENLHDVRTERRMVGGHSLLFLIEKLRPSLTHACSVDEIARVLACVPPDDLEGLQFVVLRQPKRKEEILSPVWGRYIPFFEFKDEAGSAIILESLDLTKPLRWKKPLSAHWMEQVEKLRKQGHTVTESDRVFEIASTTEAVRETQLFETLPHEVGHHVHACVDEAFHQRTTREKEDYAEKYAREFIEKFGTMLRDNEEEVPLSGGP